jgi:prolipoprotein diacylglyceryltransferase
MNPVVFQFGSIEIHAFTAWIMGGALLCTLILMSVLIRHGSRWLASLDVVVAMIVLGVVGARAGHVWLNWAYFSEHTDQIGNLANGGLDWHGAVVFGLFAAIMVAIVRRVPAIALFNALALVLPIAALAGWLASGTANAVYGVEVRTLADFPAWLATEAQDIYGAVAPRINVLPIGVLWSTIILVTAIVFTARNWFNGSRLWLILAIFAIGTGMIGFFRADYVPVWFGRRADQIMDFALALTAMGLFSITVLATKVRQQPIQTAVQGA